MTILGLETSCDETSAAVVRGGAILSNIVSSQIALHVPYGGVVPEVASRQHLRIVDQVIAQSLATAGIRAADLDAIAVTRGPGLPSALLVGVAAARGLALRLGLPLMPVHHMEAHLYSTEPCEPPFVALIVSGGHTILAHVPAFGEHRRLGQTLDDAAGEAFDKVAQLLGLPYPGGPEIERQAAKGNPKAFDFPRPMLDSGDWNFSFSGLKTAVRRASSPLLRGTALSEVEGGQPSSIERRASCVVADLSASFQAAVIEVLVQKTCRAARTLRARQIAVSGGVACNRALQRAFEVQCARDAIRLAWAPRALCTDNAGMIAQLAERLFAHGIQPPKDWDIAPDWPLAGG